MGGHLGILSLLGVFQGDPLSSYLFLIVAEGFLVLLQKAPFAPFINHLFLADNNLLFCDVEFSKIMELKRIFGLYEATSEQQINFDK